MRSDELLCHRSRDTRMFFVQEDGGSYAIDMSDRWNSETVVSDRSVTGQEGIDGLVGDGSIQSYVADDATVTYLVVGTNDGLVRETDDWETTEVPGPDSGVVVIVTDRRVVFVVGNCRDPDVDGDDVRVVDHANVEDASVANSLLSTRFTVTAADGVALSVTPTATDGLQDIANYVTKAARRWRSARDFFDDFGERLIDVEEAFADDEAAGQKRRRKLVKGLSDLGQTSSLHAIDLPALDADRDAARTRLDHATCRGCWHRARELIEAGDDHLAADALADAVTSYRDACAALRAMGEDGELAEAAFSEGSLAMELGPFDIEPALRDRLATCRERAADADVAVTTVWPVLVDGYDDLQSAHRFVGRVLDADLDGLADATAAARSEAADAFDGAIKRAEQRGDEAEEAGDSDAAREHFEEALALLDERASVTGEHDTDLRERLDEKVERSKWEWVGDR